MKFRKTRIPKEKFNALKEPIKIWDANADNIVISKLVETKTNSKYLIGYLEKYIRSLVLIMPKITGYIKTFKDKDKNSKLVSFCIGNGKLLAKYKAIWTKIEDLNNIKLNALLVYDNRYIKIKLKTYGNKVYTICRGWNVP